MVCQPLQARVSAVRQYDSPATPQTAQDPPWLVTAVLQERQTQRYHAPILDPVNIQCGARAHSWTCASTGSNRTLHGRSFSPRNPRISTTKTRAKLWQAE